MSELQGGIDLPPPETVVRPTKIRLEGWCGFAGEPGVAVTASLNSEIQDSALVGQIDRPDVAEALGPEMLRSGWALTVDLSDIAPGPLHIQVTAWGGPARGTAILGTLLVLVARGSDDDDSGDHLFEGTIDSPDLGGGEEIVPSELITIGGWALGPQGPVDEVEILIDGVTDGRARLALPRPDVAALHAGDPLSRELWALTSGFEYQVDLTGSPDGRSVRLQALGRWGNGDAYVIAEGTLSVQASQRPPTDRGEQRVADQATTSGSLVPRPAPTERLNLLVFGHGLQYGGAQLWLTELLRRAGAGQHFPCTVVSPVDGPLRQALEDMGVAVHLTRPYVVDDLQHYTDQVTELQAWAHARGHNAVLANTFEAFVGADVARLAGWPAVWAIHESWSPHAYWSTRYPSKTGSLEVRQVVDHVFADTPAVVFEAEATRRLYQWVTRPGAALVVPYGIDTATIGSYRTSVAVATARQELGIPVEARVLLVMGTIEPRKAQLLIAEAFSAIAADYPDAVLVLVGDTDSSYGREVRSLAQRSPHGNRVRVVPVVAETAPWYRAADLLVCASDIESLPRSVLEAMAFGVPALCTSVFGLPELITDGETGFLFEPRSRSALTAALRRTLDLDPAVLREVAENGRRHVVSHYDSEGYATDILALLRGLLEDPRQSPARLIQSRRLRPS